MRPPSGEIDKGSSYRKFELSRAKLYRRWPERIEMKITSSYREVELSRVNCILLFVFKKASLTSFLRQDLKRNCYPERS